MANPVLDNPYEPPTQTSLTASRPPDRDNKGDGRFVSRKAFQVLAIYAVAMGLVGLPIGLFVGPHLLLAAFGHLLVGVSAAVANYGLRHRAPWGWWTGVALPVTIIIVSTMAIRELLPSDGGLQAGVFFAISGMLFTAVLVDLIRRRPQA